MRYSIPARLAHVIRGNLQDGGPVVFVMQLPDGPPRVLEGSAALIWIIAADGNANVPAAVAEAVGRPTADIADEVRTYLDHLLETGLLESGRTL